MVTWFDWRCEHSPTRAHHFVKIGEVDRGDVFHCYYCHRDKWHPKSFDLCEMFSQMIRRIGEEDAYNKILSFHPAAKILMQKLEDLW